MNPAPESRIEGVANDFVPRSGAAVQISPFGQFPHWKGLQFFAAEDAARLVAEFAKQKALAPRNFVGLPWFLGHPDSSPKEYPDKRAYGWINSLESRRDGLYGNVRWTKAGDELIQGEAFKFFSPVWDAVSATVAGKRVLRPTRLISVGFTNTPNMPVLPLSNDGDGHSKRLGSGDLRKELASLVNAMQIEHSISYDLAFSRVKRERPDIFERMQQPSNAPSFIPPTITT